MPGKIPRGRGRNSHEPSVGSADATVSPWPDGPAQAKRRKTQKEPAIRAVNSKGRTAGRLSALPTLPLDVLYEIFGHLEPVDLLNLSRTTKAFRTVLLSSQSQFLWRSVLDAFEAANEFHFPCPEDVSIPLWVNLVYGGEHCDTCGAKARKMLWCLRRRLCKGCAKTLLVKHEEAFHMLPICEEVIGFSSALPSDWLTSTSGTRFLRSDVAELATEIANLPVKLPESGSGENRTEWKAAIAAIFATRSAASSARVKHAHDCSIEEGAKGIMRGQEIGLLRYARFQEICKRLVAMGYDECDVDSLEVREHKDVYQPKPLTERVWKRICPILCDVVEEIRYGREALARHGRRQRRSDLIDGGYEALLVSFAPPSSLSLMPTLSTFRAMPEISAFLEEDFLDDDDVARSTYRQKYTDVVAGSTHAIHEWVMGRQSSLRALLPDTWPRSDFSPTDVEAFWPINPHPHAERSPLDVFSEVADLDLVIYTFTCVRSRCRKADYRVFCGLDALAHQCHSDTTDHTLKMEANTTAHAAVLSILGLLKLESTRTRPVDLDKRDDIFIMQGSEPSSRSLMTWRQAVAACVAAPDTTLQLATDLERIYVTLIKRRRTAEYARCDVESGYSWGCAHCSDFLKGLEQEHLKYTTAMKLPWIRSHIEAKHGVRREDAVEGRDYFHLRHFARYSLHVLTSVPGLEAKVHSMMASMGVRPEDTDTET
ncbi:unnamed protein product [Peniophora sp. CBMAI 1063]|nr:unnamed protein product [Peniophora sp. CBMAI 1063]